MSEAALDYLSLTIAVQVVIGLFGIYCIVILLTILTVRKDQQEAESSTTS